MGVAIGQYADRNTDQTATTLVTKVAGAAKSSICACPDLGLKDTEDTLLNALREFGWGGAIQLAVSIVVAHAVDHLLLGHVKAVLEKGMPK